MIYLLIFLTVFVSLFILFTLSRNDFVLIRKNVSSIAIFDAVGIGFILSFLLGRILYIIDSARYGLFYPLSFLHIVKYPGISILGIFVGLFLALFSFRKKKVVMRLSDILSLAFFPILFVSIIVRTIYAPFLWVKILVAILAIFFYIMLIRFHKKYSLHDGSITYGIFLLLALDTFISELHSTHHVFIFLFSFSQWMSIGIGLFSFIGIFINEKAPRKQ